MDVAVEVRHDPDFYFVHDGELPNLVVAQVHVEYQGRSLFKSSKRYLECGNPSRDD